MVALRQGPEGAALAPFGLFAALWLLLPSCLDRQPLLIDRLATGPGWHQHLLHSPFGTIHAPNYLLPQPLGTATEPHAVGPTAGGADDPGDPTARASRIAPAARVFPTVDRHGKGDLLFARSDAPLNSRSEADELPVELRDALAAPAAPEEDGPDAPTPGSPPLASNVPASAPDLSILAAAADPDPSQHVSEVYFAPTAAIGALAALEPWAEGEAPMLIAPAAPVDSEFKSSALGPPGAAEGSGLTVAGKGEVTGEGRRPRSPAELLRLDESSRAKAEKCLANAIYFEARGQSVRGQIAVAQVVMNRVFSGYYPNTVCAVVYQNAHRHLACQFTFACDGIADVVTEPEAYSRAKLIAARVLDGRLWLPEIGKATHYHAYWVHPSWVRTMHKLYRIGVHTFYRPRRWGEGSEPPAWASPAQSALTAARL